MNVTDFITAICSAAALLISLITLAFVAPLRRSQERTEKLVDEKAKVVDIRLNNHGDRLRSMEVGQVSASSEALKVFMTKADFNTLIDQFGTVNDQLDRLIEARGASKFALEELSRQTTELFRQIREIERAKVDRADCERRHQHS